MWIEDVYRDEFTVHGGELYEEYAVAVCKLNESDGVLHSTFDIDRLPFGVKANRVIGGERGELVVGDVGIADVDELGLS